MAVKRALSWPPPVYVATFADGTVCRMSCSAYEKKFAPYDFGKGRRMACSAIGAGRAREARWLEFAAKGYTERDCGIWHPDDERRWNEAHGVGPATDLIAGHFEDGDKIVPDPFFEPEIAKPTRKGVSTLSRLIDSLGKLSAGDLVALSVEVDARLMAAE